MLHYCKKEKLGIEAGLMLSQKFLSGRAGYKKLKNKAVTLCLIFSTFGWGSLSISCGPSHYPCQLFLLTQSIDHLAL